MNMHVMTPTQERLAIERRERLARMNRAASEHQKRMEQREADALREARQDAERIKAEKEARIQAAVEQMRAMKDEIPVARICKIRDLVAKEFSLTVEQLTSKKRLHCFTRPRFVYSYLAHEIYGYSYMQTANVVGFTDHTSVINGIRRYKDALSKDPEIVAIVERIIAQVGAP